MNAVESHLLERSRQLEIWLEKNLFLKEDEEKTPIRKAVKHSCFAGGKCLRPTLLLESYQLFSGKDASLALPFAAAVELIHTYSLIHDDLPCMDDDDLRRGKPTCHKVYGEAMALLAGDALLTRAFEIGLTPSYRAGFDDAVVLKTLAILSRAAGLGGMVGGQAMDLHFEHAAISEEDLRDLQRRKTGALLEAAAHMGATLAGANEKGIAAIRAYAQNLGLAFQIRDDLLDECGTEATLGKAVRKDEKAGKNTFPALLGVEKCHEMLNDLTEQAVVALHGHADARFLIALAHHLKSRET